MSVEYLRANCEKIRSLQYCSTRRQNLRFPGTTSSFTQNNLPRFVGRGGRFEYLRDYVDGVSKTLGALPRTRSELQNPEIGYCFATEKVIEDFRKDNKGRDFENFVNHSPDAAAQWLNQILKDIRDSPKPGNSSDIANLFTLRGKIGSGKTTFINYVQICHQEDFLRNKVLPIRINYSALGIAAVQKSRDVPKIQAHFKEVFESKLSEAFYAISHLIEINPESVTKALEYAALEREQFKSSEDLRKDLAYVLDSFARLKDLSVSNSTFWKKHLRILSSKGPFSKIGVSNYLIFEDWRILYIVDGLDHLRVDEMTRGDFKAVIKSLFALLDGEGDFGVLRERECSYLFTFRHCTEDIFLKQIDRSKGLEPQQADLAPAGDLQLLLRSARYYLYAAQKQSPLENRKLYLEYIRRLYEITKEAFELKPGQDLSALFNHNYRKLIRFFNKLHQFLGANYHFGESRTLDELIGYLSSDEFVGNLRKKDYRIREIFLLEDGSQFKNFIACRVDNLTSSIIIESENVVGRGFVDNIFDYCEDAEYLSESTVPPFLMKFRILQYLTAKGYRPIDELLRALSDLGYEIPLSAIDSIMDIMIYSDFVKTAKPNGAELQYAATALGKFVVETFCCHLEYVEHVVQSTRFPKVMADMMIGAKKFGKSGLERWIEGSIANSVIFVGYVGYCQAQEKVHGENSGENLWNSINLDLYSNLKNRTLETLDITVDKFKAPGRTLGGQLFWGAEAKRADIIVSGWNKIK